MSNYIEASVIASFDTKGNIMPLYFRSDNSAPIKVSVKSTRIGASFIIFSCEYYLKERDEIKSVTLEYDIDNHVWNVVTDLFF